MQQIQQPIPTNDPSVYSYDVTFQVQYETELGQELAIIGSLLELGEWKDFTAKLTWTDGHIWVLPNLKTQESVF